MHRFMHSIDAQRETSNGSAGYSQFRPYELQDVIHELPVGSSSIGMAAAGRLLDGFVEKE